MPWNRHVRRRVWKTSELVVHLFSGGDEKTWQELGTEDRVVLCIDLALDRGHTSGAMRWLLTSWSFAAQER